MRATPWWRWLAATFIILSAWIYLAPLFTAVTRALVPVGPAWATLAVDLSSFIPLFLATPLVWRFMFGLNIGSLINRRGRVDAARLGLGFGAWLALCALSTGIDWALHANEYRVTFALGAFAPFAIITALLLPVQTWAEELFFRGWILRWSTALPLPAQVVISGAVFALPHLGNPEAASDALPALLAYFLLGATWAYVSVRDGGIELAMGAHLANNAFSLLIVGYDDAALPTSAIVTTSNLNLTATIISLAIIGPVFALITGRRPRI